MGLQGGIGNVGGENSVKPLELLTDGLIGDIDLLVR